MYQVVHSSWGRYRIRIPRLAIDVEFANRLSNLVTSLKFVTSVRINSSASSLIVIYQPDIVNQEDAQQHIINCIKSANNIKLEIIPIPATVHTEAYDSIPTVNKWENLGLPILSLSLAVLAAPLELPVILVGAAIAGAAMPWLQRASNSIIQDQQPNIDLLDYTWMALQTIQGQYIAPALKTSLVEIRRALRGTVLETKQQAAVELLNYLNQAQWQKLPIGDRITIYSGERIPVDGQIISGSGWVNSVDQLGTDTPVFCQPGEYVYAGSGLQTGELSILVKRTGNQTKFGLIANLIQSAPVYDTQIALQQAELTKQAIIPTLAVGGIVFALTGNIGAAISPYQLDFGSGIPITVSTTMLSALTQATRNGIYIRSGRILEILAQVDTLVVDESIFGKLEGDSQKVIDMLQKQGIVIYLHRHQNIEAELIEQLQTQGKIIAVLSDNHDSPQNIHTISIADGDDIANSTADIMLMDNNLWGLVDGIAIAKRTMEIVYQNTAMIVIPNLIMQIGGGMFLGVNPAWNVIVNNGSAFIAEFLNHDPEILYRFDARS